MSASSNAVRRLRRDFESFSRSAHPNISAQPSSSNLLEWHFLFHDLPEDTPYAAGVYHGRLVFPIAYPLAPPKVYMCTPNGRLEVDQPICLSATDFHPEQWNPAWTAGSLLLGLLSFFLSEDNATGVTRRSRSERQRLAALSFKACRDNPELQEMFPGLLSSTSEAAASNVDDLEDPPESAQMLSRVLDPTRRAIGRTITQVEKDHEQVEGAGECWICRDEASNEPLINPCACRGSMGGVHASCINAWVLRASEHNQGLPRCPVCKQEFEGCHAVKPGLTDFAKELCEQIMHSPLLHATVRFCVQWVFTYYYVEHWKKRREDTSEMRTALFFLLGTGFTMCLLHKAVVFTVSLQRGNLCAACRFELAPAPQTRVLSWFHAGDQRRLSHFFHETVFVFVYWVCSPAITFTPASSLPFVVYLLPLVKVLAYQSINPCFRHIAMFLASTACSLIFLALIIIIAPVIMIFIKIGWLLLVVVIAVMHHHPLDAGPHIVVALLVSCLTTAPQWGGSAARSIDYVRHGKGVNAIQSLPALWANQSFAAPRSSANESWNETMCIHYEAKVDELFPLTLREACVLLLVLHSIILLGFLFEGLVFRRLEWRTGKPQWALSVWVALSTWLDLSPEFLTPLLKRCSTHWTINMVATSATTWFLSIGALALMVEFKRWQNVQSWRLVVADPMDEP